MKSLFFNIQKLIFCFPACMCYVNYVIGGLQSLRMFTVQCGTGVVNYQSKVSKYPSVLSHLTQPLSSLSLFFEIGLPCSSGCPTTLYVEQIDLELRFLPASGFQLLKLKSWQHRTTSLFTILLMIYIKNHLRTQDIFQFHALGEHKF